MERSSRFRHRRKANARVLAVSVPNRTTWRVPLPKATDVFAKWALSERLMRQEILWAKVKPAV